MVSNLGPTPSEAPPTLQFRVTAAVVVIFVATLVVFTAIDLAGERKAFLRTENRHAAVVLTHLAAMAQPRPALHPFEREVASLNVPLRSVGAHVELLPLPVDVSRETRVVASRRILLDGRPFEMRYRLHEATMRRVAMNAIGLHLLHGLIATVAIVLVTATLVRTRLIQPLALMTHQIAHIRKGGGWIPVLPAVDAELRPMTEAISGLGPGLEEQVKEWVETERRAGVALAFVRLENAMREPLHRAQSAVRDLETLHAASDDLESIRSLRGDIDQVSAVISDGRLWEGEFVAVGEQAKELEASRSGGGPLPRKKRHA